MLPTLLVLVSLALVVCLGLLIFGRGAPSRAHARSAPAASVSTGPAPPLARGGPDPELDKRRREVEELRVHRGRAPR